MDYSQASGQQNNRYDQREQYLTAATMFKPSEKLAFSWANDFLYGSIHSRFAFPEREVSAGRTTWMSALSARVALPRLDLTGSLLYQAAWESLQVHRRHLSPYLGLSVQPLPSLPLRLRGYYKNTYRLPTFGDIYFSPAPNLNLQAENAHQYNLGATWAQSFGELIPYFSLSADAYYNRIHNKLVALPRGSMVIWSVLNYGEAAVRGLDLQADIRLALAKGFAAQINGNYTWQRVQDKTPESAYYDSHLPYTPRHTGSGRLSLETPWLEVNYSLIYSGVRYINQTTLANARLNAYAEQSLSLAKAFRYRKIDGRFSVECRNLGNAGYEVVRNYPMPGRSFQVNIQINY
jgi:outer membrane receptor protein involved in Fe transport